MNAARVGRLPPDSRKWVKAAFTAACGWGARSLAQSLSSSGERNDPRSLKKAVISCLKDWLIVVNLHLWFLRFQPFLLQLLLFGPSAGCLEPSFKISGLAGREEREQPGVVLGASDSLFDFLNGPAVGQFAGKENLDLFSG